MSIPPNGCAVRALHHPSPKVSACHCDGNSTEEEFILKRHAVPKKRTKSVRDDRAMLDDIILPKLGAKKVDAIGRRGVEPIQVATKDRPYQANRVLSLLSKMFNLAVEWKWRPDNPAKSIERYQEQKR